MSSFLAPTFSLPHLPLLPFPSPLSLSLHRMNSVTPVDNGEKRVLSWSLGQLPPFCSRSLLLSFSAQRIFFTPFSSSPLSSARSLVVVVVVEVWAQGYAHGMVLLTRALNGSNSTSLSRPLSPSRSGFPSLFLPTTRFSRTGSVRGTDRPSVRLLNLSLPLFIHRSTHNTTAADVSKCN